MKAIFTITSVRGLAAAGIFGALASGFAAAAPTADGFSPQIIVKYVDLNVLSPPGATALYGRIRAAGLQVCGGYINDRDLAAKVRQESCLHKAIADAVVKVNQPALFAAYNMKNQPALSVLVASNHVR